jgi:predicted nucleotidyltransferase
MNEQDYKIVEQFKQKLVENQIPVREIFVFGSRARGDAGPDSDLDVLVIVDERNSAIRKKVSDCAWEVGFASDIVIQSILRTKADVEEGPEKSSLFLRSVQQEGIRV